MLSLLILPLVSKRDVLLARQRARQIAALFHFPAQEQSCIAAGAFAVAAQALRETKTAELCFQVVDRKLLIFPRARKVEVQPGTPAPPNTGTATDGLLRLVKALPPAGAEFPPEDMVWLVNQLHQGGRFNLFEEIQHQNQEMLALIHGLQHAQAELEQLRSGTSTTSAA